MSACAYMLKYLHKKEVKHAPNRNANTAHTNTASTNRNTASTWTSPGTRPGRPSRYTTASRAYRHRPKVRQQQKNADICGCRPSCTGSCLLCSYQEVVLSSIHLDRELVILAALFQICKPRRKAFSG